MHSGNISLQHVVTVKATTTNVSTMEVDNTQLLEQTSSHPNPFYIESPRYFGTEAPLFAWAQ